MILETNTKYLKHKMKYLRTKSGVDYNSPNKLSGQEQSIIIGVLPAGVIRNGVNYVAANYVYAKETIIDEQPKYEMLVKDGFEITSESEITSLYNAVLSSLPDLSSVSEPEYNELKNIYAFRLKMVDELTLNGMNPGLTEEDISIESGDINLL
jgi:hypothetical protein